MKKSIVALLATVGLLGSQTAWAQSQVINIPTACTTTEALAALLVEYDETPALTMTSVRASKEQNKSTTNPTLMFINYETKSWTLIERMADNVVRLCITRVVLVSTMKKAKSLIGLKD